MSEVSDPCLVIHQMCVASEPCFLNFPEQNENNDTRLFPLNLRCGEKSKLCFRVIHFHAGFPRKWQESLHWLFLPPKNCIYPLIVPPLPSLTLLLYLCPIYFHALPLEFVNLVSLFPCLRCKNVSIKIINILK